jgi:hypothetical protein
MKLILNKKDMQGLGSAITYARRYSICALIGIVDTEDDDGNASLSDKPKPQVKPTGHFPDMFMKGIPPQDGIHPIPKNYAPSVDDLDRALDQSLPSPVEELFAMVEMYKVPHKDMPGIIEEVTGSKIKSVDLNEGQIASVISFIRHQYSK